MGSYKVKENNSTPPPQKNPRCLTSFSTTCSSLKTIRHKCFFHKRDKANIKLTFWEQCKSWQFGTLEDGVEKRSLLDTV